MLLKNDRLKLYGEDQFPEEIQGIHAFDSLVPAPCIHNAEEP